MRRLLRIAGRVVGWGLVALVGVFLVLCTVGEVRQRVLVHRAKDLMMDIQSLQDHKSTWADAQRLMTKWGKWGRWEGSCTAVDCMYVVTLRSEAFDAETNFRKLLGIVGLFRLVPHQFGGGVADVRGMFLVQDGLLRRKGLSVATNVTPAASGVTWSMGNPLVIAQVVERGSLGGEYAGEGWRGRNPSFVTWSPGGCSFCVMTRVTLASSSDVEFRRRSNFDLGCVTRWNPCLETRELRPDEETWYPKRTGAEQSLDWQNFLSRAPSDVSAYCDIPLSSRSRDASSVMEVEALENSAQPTPTEYETLVSGVRVRLLRVLYGAVHSHPGDTVKLALSGHAEAGQPVSVRKGDTYLLLVDYDSTDDDHHLGPCEVVRENTESRAAVDRGLVLRDRIRGHEPTVSVNGFSRDSYHATDF